MSERLLRHGASSRLNHPNLTDISQATDRPTNHPPTVFSPLPALSLSLPLLLFSSLFIVVSYPLATTAATRALSPYVDQATNSSPPPSQPACLPACFPIPHSILFVVARTLRGKVTSRSRVSQDPANPSWYKIAPSGSQRRRRRSRRNADGGRAMSGNWDSARIGTMRYRRRRGILVADGHCGTFASRRETFD